VADEQQEAAAPRAWPVAVQLKHPVMFGSEQVTALEFRRGKMGDMKGIKLSGDDISADDLMMIASRMCGKPLKVLEMLDVDDAGEVTSIALDFYVSYLGAGRGKSRR
jgi:hypothetical protein